MVTAIPRSGRCWKLSVAIDSISKYTFTASSRVDLRTGRYSKTTELYQKLLADAENGSNGEDSESALLLSVSILPLLFRSS